MKGKSLIEPGYEANSKFCDGCKLKKDFFCLAFDELLEAASWHEYERCKPCLESEVKQ